MADDTTIKPEGPTKTKWPKVLGGPAKSEELTEPGGLSNSDSDSDYEYKEPIMLQKGSAKTRREKLFRSEEWRTKRRWLFPRGSLKSEEQSTLQKGSTKTRREELFRSPATESLKIEEPSTEFKEVLYQTQILHIVDEYYMFEHRLHEAETQGQKSGHTMFQGGKIKQPVKWKSLDNETQLMMDDTDLFHDDFPDFISILCPMCPVVKHVFITVTLYMYAVGHFLHMRYMGQPSTERGMKSVRTVCMKMNSVLSLDDVLWTVREYFPNAESLDVECKVLYSLDSISSSKVNHSSVLKKLKLTANEIGDKREAADLFFSISKTLPNITSLVISGITSIPLNRSKHKLQWKLPYLTNIQLDNDEGGFYPFETLSNVLNLISVEIPQLELLEANKVSLELGINMPLASVTWSRISSGCELKLEDVSATVPLVDLIQLVSNELKGVTSLRLERCNVKLPKKIDRPKQKLGEGSSLRELQFFRKKNLRKAELQKLSKMYPDVKVRVFDGSNVSYDVAVEQRPQPGCEDSQLGNLEKTVISERQISSSSLSLLGEEVNVTPVMMECRQKVGIEGGKLQLETFGIELDIPPGAIDSETPQEISLRVLTDTPNLGNSEEFSVCFGVQCLAPDDLVLKCPVTYTIPHCAAFTRFSSVDAVLYTGEGEYTPNSVVKQRIKLRSYGIPSCTIKKDVFKLKMNHFSWVKIKQRVKKFFFRGKRMCSQPFAESTLPEQRKQVILRTYLYDDIPGNREIIRRDEEEQDFKPVHPEIQIPIKTAAVDLSMTCYIHEEIIGGPAVVNFDRLNSGTIICEPFTLNFTNHSDRDPVVSLKVGQTRKFEVNLTFRLKFQTIHRTASCTTQDQVIMEGASTSQVIRSPKSKDEKSLNPVKKAMPIDANTSTCAGQEDFDDMLSTVAESVTKDTEIDRLGKKLGFDPTNINRYRDANRKNYSYMGTLQMLRDWRKKQTKDTEHAALKVALEEAGQIRLAAEMFDS